MYSSPRYEETLNLIFLAKRVNYSKVPESYNNATCMAVKITMDKSTNNIAHTKYIMIPSNANNWLANGSEQLMLGGSIEWFIVEINLTAIYSKTNFGCVCFFILELSHGVVSFLAGIHNS